MKYQGGFQITHFSFPEIKIYFRERETENISSWEVSDPT